MNQENETHAETGRLLDDAQELLAATKEVGEQKVVEARKRLADALDRARKTWNTVQDKAVAGAKATDQLIRTHPYESMAAAMGIGALIGYLLASRRSN